MTIRNKDYVVYVPFPNSNKEYSYLCNIPGLNQGDQAIANGATVTIQRTADNDPRATRYVSPLPNQKELARKARRIEIADRLRTLERQQRQLDLWIALAKKNPEARKLLAELKRMK